MDILTKWKSSFTVYTYVKSSHVHFKYPTIFFQFYLDEAEKNNIPLF